MRGLDQIYHKDSRKHHHYYRRDVLMVDFELFSLSDVVFVVKCLFNVSSNGIITTTIDDVVVSLLLLLNIKQTGRFHQQ